jgi:hypothetical protein
MLCIGVNKIKTHFDTSQLCCGVVHLIIIVTDVQQVLDLRVLSGPHDFFRLQFKQHRYSFNLAKDLNE